MVEPTCTGPFRIGDDIIGYKVLGLLGAGGQAFVYESKDPYLGHPVAIKVIQKPPGGSDLVSRGRAEAKILTELLHPNVVRVHLARPLSSSMICIVMEKLDGISLRHMLRLYKRFTITETLHIVRQIADALSAAHKMNVIHRDIKPENVFVLPPDNKVKVLDFGIAKLAGLGLTTNKFRFHGTPIYMAPEHLSDGTVTVRSDVYQLMLVAFEMMTGTHPYLVGADCGIEAVVLRQLQRPPPLLSTRLPGAPPGVEFLIKKGTARDPSQRFQSMEALIVAIDKILRDRDGIDPQEANDIRYLDAKAVQAALALDSEHDPWADEEPLESADTEAAAPPPFSVAPVVPSVAVTVDDGRFKPGNVGASRGTDPDPLAATEATKPPTVQPRPTPSPAPATAPGATSARRTAMGLGPTMGRAESMASIPRPVVKRPSSALAPTVEISREPTAVARAESVPPSRTKAQPTPSQQPSSIPRANLSPTPAPNVAASARPAQTSDGYAAPPNHQTTKIITPRLLLSGAIVGTVIGLASSWSTLQQAYIRRMAQAQEGASANSVQVIVEPSPSARQPAMTLPTPALSYTVASPLPVVRRIPEEPAAEDAPPTTAEQASPARAAVAAPPKPKKPTPRNETIDTETPLIPGGSSKATKEELARMQARVREFKADMEREAREKKAREASK